MRVSAYKTSENLRGEVVGRLDHFDQVLQLDVLLASNTFTTTAVRLDANGARFELNPTGRSVKAGNGGNGDALFANGAGFLRLSLPNSPATAVEFADPAAPGAPQYGTFEDGQRETASRQLGIHGLNVTRKFFVPDTGYFMRMLESLSNPTTEPITVDVEVTSNMYQTWGNQSSVVLYPQATSSGDATLAVGPVATPDRWVVMDDLGEDADTYFAPANHGTPVAFVFDGSGGRLSVSDIQASVLPGGYVPMKYAWRSVTVPRGRHGQPAALRCDAGQPRGRRGLGRPAGATAARGAVGPWPRRDGGGRELRRSCGRRQRG